MNICVFGHSHVICLQAALPTIPAEHNTHKVKIFDLLPLTQEDITELTRGNMEVITRPFGSFINSKEDTIWVSRVGGNAHNAIGLMSHSRKFDVVIPERPNLPLDEDAEVVTYGYLRASFINDPHTKLWISILANFQKEVGGRVYHIESPPPKEDDEFIERYLDPYFKALPNRNKIVNRWIRWKLWSAYSSVIESVCKDIGICYLRTPPVVMTEDGFLRREGYANDATHGNAWYGTKLIYMLNNVADMIEGEISK